MPEIHRSDKRQGLHPSLFSRARVDSIENSPADCPETDGKCESQASCGGVPTSITTHCAEGYINRAGKVVLRFDTATDFSEGAAAVEIREMGLH